MISSAVFNNSRRSPDTHRDDEDVQTVPQALEVMQPVDVDLQHFLHHIVEDEKAECHFTHTHKVVPAGHVSYETDGLELPGRHHPTSSRKLHQQPDRYIKFMLIRCKSNQNKSRILLVLRRKSYMSLFMNVFIYNNGRKCRF